MELIIIFVIYISFLLCGILLLLGKAKFLIAGLNTASKEEKENWNEKTIGTITGTLLLVMANTILACFLIPHYNSSLRNICTSIFLFTCISSSVLAIFLANKYGKK
ncbi:MAG: DUF3784 domain-containing protein [Treponema sp.]